MFQNLSYFEMRLDDGEYISPFPCTKTQAGSASLLYSGSYLFPGLSMARSSKTEREPIIAELANHLRNLAANSCNFSNYYWFVDLKRAGGVVSSESTVIDINDLYSWLSSLYFYSVVDDYTSPHNTKYVIRSTDDSSFSMECYKTLDSSPQELNSVVLVPVIVKHGDETIFICHHSITVKK